MGITEITHHVVDKIPAMLGIGSIHSRRGVQWQHVFKYRGDLKKIKSSSNNSSITKLNIILYVLTRDKAVECPGYGGGDRLISSYAKSYELRDAIMKHFFLRSTTLLCGESSTRFVTNAELFRQQ